MTQMHYLFTDGCGGVAHSNACHAHICLLCAPHFRVCGPMNYYYYKKKRFRWRNVKKTPRTPYNAKTVTKLECDAKCEHSVSQMRS